MLHLVQIQVTPLIFGMLKRAFSLLHVAFHALGRAICYSEVAQISELFKMRLVILNTGLRPKFREKIGIFPRSGCMNAPFFLKRQYIEGLQKKYLFFPWRSPPLTYYPLNKCKYRNYSLFCEMGGFWGKGRTPGERWPKCLQWTQLFWKNSIGSLTLLVEEQIGFQNSKFWKNTLIWPHFCEGMLPTENEVK